MNKDPRIKDLRSDIRSDERGVPLTFTDNSGFNVPNSILEANPDKRYCFVAYESAGVELHDDYDLAVNKRGFQPSLLNDYPALKRKHAISPFRSGSRADDDQLIKYRNHVLMERPVELHDAEANFYDEKNKHHSAAAELHSLDPNMPRSLKVQSRSYGPRRF